MNDARTPSDDLQHIKFEGCDVCVIAPEDYDALVAALEDARDIVDNIVSGFPANDQVLLETLGYMDAALKAARGES